MSLLVVKPSPFPGQIAASPPRQLEASSGQNKITSESFKAKKPSISPGFKEHAFYISSLVTWLSYTLLLDTVIEITNQPQAGPNTAHPWI